MTGLSVAIVSPGAMGAALGRRLASRGAMVSTLLEGRSPASAQRAAAAGMTPRSIEQIGDCDLLLSVTPPDAALPLARALAPHLDRRRPRLAYVDCNAIAPRTAVEIEKVLSGVGAAFVDAALVGGPPDPDGFSPALYASGPEARRLASLVPLGLDVRILAAPVGAASALKMALAAVAKGLTGVFTLGLLAAAEARVAEPFLAHLGETRPDVLVWGRAQLPKLDAKAGRWVEEMRILESLCAATPGGETVFAGLAELYGGIAADGSAVRAAAALVKS